MTLTGRQRVLRTLNRESVDRMPIDLGIHFSTGISAFAYFNLRERLGLSTDRIEIADTTQFLARVDDDVRRRFHVDTALLNPPWRTTRRWNPRGRYSFLVPEAMDPQLQEDGSWIVRQGEQAKRLPPGGFFFEGGWFGFDPRSEAEWFADARAEAERRRGDDDPAMMVMGFNAFFSDHPEWLMWAASEPEAVMAKHEELLKAQCARVDRIHAALGDRIQLLEVNSDLGAQRAPLASPKMWERVSQPYLKRLIAHIHNTTPYKVFMHSCGSICPMIPGIIDAGVDALNPVQVSAAGMDPAELKRRFGSKIVFWGGGCDTQTILPRGTPDEVRANVRQLVGTLGAGGGFVFNMVHNIMGDVPADNIIAMFDTAWELAQARTATAAG